MTEDKQVRRLSRALVLCEGQQLAGASVCFTASGASVELFFSDGQSTSSGETASVIRFNVEGLSKVEARGRVSLEKALEYLDG